MMHTDVFDQLESVDCPVCGSNQHTRLFVARDRLVGLPGEFPVVRCQRCHFVFLNPRPTAESLPAWYPDVYYPVDGGAETPEAIDVARGLLERVESAEPGRTLSILDVGCGTGLFLKFARDAGHQVRGIELSESAVTYGQQVYGLPIETGTIESVELSESSFDVITMWHVLEHLADPVVALERISQLLKPGGLLLFGVPNIESYEARLFGRRWFSLDAPRHLGHFSPQTARRVVESAGMAVDRIDHSAGTAGLVYSLMGDLTGVSLKLRGRGFSDATYHRIAGVIGLPAGVVCRVAARFERGGAIEVYARNPVD
jgi:SAM-dependent methyltransferase